MYDLCYFELGGLKCIGNQVIVKRYMYYHYLEMSTIGDFTGFPFFLSFSSPSPFLSLFLIPLPFLPPLSLSHPSPLSPPLSFSTQGGLVNCSNWVMGMRNTLGPPN